MRRVVAIVTLLAACAGPMTKIDAVRDALEKDDGAAIKNATAGYPACADAPPVAVIAGQPSPRDTGCFAEIAGALGSKRGFRTTPPDHAAATTVAIVLLRDGRGDWVTHADAWLHALKNGKGSGPDALRLAVGRKMADAAPLVGRRIEDDKAARETMKAVAGAIPGACPTYWLLGSGADPSAVPAEHSAEHAACVHQDLARREGPGSSYGEGTFRALEGSLALWREAERSLRLGLSLMGGGVKARVEAQLQTIEKGTQAIATRKLAMAMSAPVVEMLAEAHAEAGVVLWKDAGARDGGAKKPP